MKVRKEAEKLKIENTKQIKDRHIPEVCESFFSSQYERIYNWGVYQMLFQ